MRMSSPYKQFSRSKRDTKAVVTVPTIRGRYVSFILVMDSKKVIYFKTISRGNCNAKRLAGLREKLREKLTNPNNRYLVLDNARVHRAEEVWNKMEDIDVKVKYLPPPIKKIINKEK